MRSSTTSLWSTLGSAKRRAREQSWWFATLKWQRLLSHVVTFGLKRSPIAAYICMSSWRLSLVRPTGFLRHNAAPEIFTTLGCHTTSCFRADIFANGNWRSQYSGVLNSRERPRTQSAYNAPQDWRIWLKIDGKPASFWHDVPTYPDPSNTSIVNFVVEIPRWEDAKIEIRRDEPLSKLQKVPSYR